jgi:hypothetical protein
MVLTGHRGLKESLESLDRRANRVFKEKSVLRAYRASRGYRARLVLRVILGTKAPKVFKVSKESKVFRERLALKGIQVSRAHKVKQD